jgi:excinuclease ABC subunit C
VSYHKKLRSKEIEESKLDQIQGVGPKRKARLIRHFGSLENIEKASPEEIGKVKGINEKLARLIHRQLQDNIENSTQSKNIPKN